MSSLFVALFPLVASSFRTRAALQAEILALRHQIAVFQKNAPRRLRLQGSDRFLWVLLSPNRFQPRLPPPMPAPSEWQYCGRFQFYNRLESLAFESIQFA